MQERGVLLLKQACEMALRGDRTSDLMAKAIAAVEEGEIDAAIDAAEEVIIVNPRNLDAVILQGILLLHEKTQAVLANRRFGQVVSEDANSSIALWYAAIDAMCRGSSPVALALLEAGTKMEPIDTFAGVTLAWLLAEIGNQGGAAEILLRKTRLLQDRLICLAVAEAVVKGSTMPQDAPESRSSERLRCLMDLVGFQGRAGLNARRLLAADIAGLEAAGAKRLGRGACDHLRNPALEGYGQRLGMRAMTHYANHFLQMILRPEIERAGRTTEFGDLLSEEHRKNPPSDMVEVPDGEYPIGTEEKEKGHPLRVVKLRRFYLDRYPITNWQWREFRPDHRFPNGADTHPVTNIDFVQATMYAHWRGKRLPTEGEWEAGARGRDGRPFPWGDLTSPDKANCAEQKRKGLTAVTAFPRGASPFGAMDMMGNAAEWVDAWEPGGNQQRIVKGFGSGVSANVLFCWGRTPLPPLRKNAAIGFRCASDP